MSVCLYVCLFVCLRIDKILKVLNAAELPKLLEETALREKTTKQGEDAELLKGTTSSMEEPC